MERSRPENLLGGWVFHGEARLKPDLRMRGLPDEGRRAQYSELIRTYGDCEPPFEVSGWGADIGAQNATHERAADISDIVKSDNVGAG
jgi:hypothetical protein